MGIIEVLKELWQPPHHDTRIGRPFGLPILDCMCKFRLVELVN